jgi:hypothetical protein
MRKWIGLGLLVLLLLPAATGRGEDAFIPATIGPDGRAGTCYAFYHDPPGGSERPYLPMAYAAGSRWDRFDFAWPTLEPENDEWNFAGHDELVNDLDAAGMNMVGILLWTPDWASTGGEQTAQVPDRTGRPAGWYAPTRHAAPSPHSPTAASSPPAGLDLPWDHPDNHWGNFVYRVVSRYGDRVKTWEVWNEAEWSYFWTGSAADYARLLTVGYQATKAACPDCRVLFAGLHYWADPTFFERVLDTLNDDPQAAANNYYFDVMSIHFYSTSDHAYSLVNHIRSRMMAYVPDHPLWLTETGVPVWDDAGVDPHPFPYDWAATEEEAAAYVLQSYAGAWASGVERYFFFRTHDADMGEYFGLVRNDRSLRPAYAAYQVATTYLVSPTFTTRVVSGPVTRVTLWGTPRGKVSLLWNTGPDAVHHDYPATLPTALQVDRLGITHTLSPVTGVYPLDLAGATANLVSDPEFYFIGGDPLLVIESEVHPAAPTSTLHALPATTYAHSVPVTWEGHDEEAGVWLYDVQVQDGPGGEWESWLHGTTGTSGQYPGRHGHTYCFRARATDRVGCRETWPAGAEACTTVDLDRRVEFRVDGVFGDENGNGVQDGEEQWLPEVQFRFVDPSGADVFSPVLGASWTFTATLMAGDYTLIATPPGWWSPEVEWLPRRVPVVVEPGMGVQTLSLPDVGLPPHRDHFFLPDVSRQ